jgi:hypothetical protein
MNSASYWTQVSRIIESGGTFESYSAAYAGAKCMSDIKDPRLLYLKGTLFLFAGCVAAGLIVAEQPTLRVALLLAVAIWAFCRAYYFAFYVIERYVDSS